MPRKPPKLRISLSNAESADVLFASDNTCCVCRDSRRTPQIHHIDDDPAHNDPSNLAVLCLECHHQTQVHGGFGRALSAEVVRRYRDEWLHFVQQRRADQRGQALKAAPAASTVSRMTLEQARERAKKLRAMYAPFFTGIGYVRDYIVRLDAPIVSGETWEAREARLKPIWDEGYRLIDGARPQLWIEPGSKQVRALFDRFQKLRDRCMVEIVYEHDHPGFWSRVSKRQSIDILDKVIEELQAAIHAHIASLDQLT